MSRDGIPIEPSSVTIHFVSGGYHYNEDFKQNVL
jgi:hypothetical protein